MQRQSFFNRSVPAITFLTKCGTMEEFCSGISIASDAGADGIAVELADLPPEERTIDNYRKMMQLAPHLPFMFIVYRNDKWHGNDDEARQKYLFDAIEAGCEVVDVMGDLYCPSPRELALDEAAVAKQKSLISKIHSAGAKVVMSSHTHDFMTGTEVLAHLQSQSERGADILKLVSASDSEEEFSSQIKTTMMLSRTLDKPFIHLSRGAWSRPHRFLSPVFGSGIAFARNNSGELQPSIKEFKEFMATFNWHISDVQER